MIKHNYRARREFFATLMFSLFVFTYIFSRTPLFVAKGESIEVIHFPEEVKKVEIHTAEKPVKLKFKELKSRVAPSVGTEKAEGLDKPKYQYVDISLDKGLQEHVFKTCEKYGIKPGIVFAMIERESGFRVDAIGDSGNSLGLMQIQPRWNQARMERLGCYDLLDPYQNITVGVDVLAEYLNSSGGSLEWALMAYNGGPSYANNKTACGVVSDYAASIIMRSGSFA